MQAVEAQAVATDLFTKEKARMLAEGNVGDKDYIPQGLVAASAWAPSSVQLLLASGFVLSSTRVLFLSPPHFQQSTS
jgi:hypothetical protein